MARKVTVAEIAAHSKTDDVWIVVDGKVYDMTEFAPSHPGGDEIIYRYAGRDASREYNEIHAPSLIKKTLEQKHHVGDLDEASVTDEWRAVGAPVTGSAAPAPDEPPSLQQIINLHDFELAANRMLSAKSWAYISGASNDNISRDMNLAMLRRIWFRPAVMQDVGSVNTRTKLFGCDLALPVYICPTGAVRQAGPDGEIAQAKGAGASGIIQCMSTPASFPHEEIIDATRKHAFFQLYVDKDRTKSEAALRRVTASGKIKAIFVTVDLPVVSKREADERVLQDQAIVNPNTGMVTTGQDSKGSGLARSAGSFIDPTLSWDDIPWIRKHTNLPIVIKGIQRWEDAKLAMQHGCQGIVVSNHGGRAADTASPTILTLLELHRNCPEVFGAMEVLIDGGFRRGSDVVKAICLGATAVGIGRSFMYATLFGEEGVQHAVQLLREEIETAMRLCGISRLAEQASPDYVNSAAVDHLVTKGGHPYAVKTTKLKARL